VENVLPGVAGELLGSIDSEPGVPSLLPSAFLGEMQ